MAGQLGNVGGTVVSEHRAKKRKLRYPRASAACVFCRRRKARCSGHLPCEACVREEITCEYNSGTPSDGSLPARPQDGSILKNTSAVGQIRTALFTPSTTTQQLGNDAGESGSFQHIGNTSTSSRRSSVDQPQAFMPESHLGPTSGVSFLYHPWDKHNDANGKTLLPNHVNDDEGGEGIARSPLASYGDIPQPTNYALVPKPSFTVDQITDLCDRYFQYISPTYRFLHYPTTKSWAISYVTNTKLSSAKQACVLLVCAQTLLHTSIGSVTASAIGPGDIELSLLCAEKAKLLLQDESGPPSLTSIQARLGLALYLLSIFRLNECRYCFGFAVTIATALGLHRHQSSSRANSLDAECQRRTFWSLYILDGYLSVMLGKPRSFRDEDVDQPFPQNISDQDLASSEPLESLPRHGDLEAAIMHARLAKLLARNNDLLYPLHHLSNDQILSRSTEMLDALADWRNELPEFLKPRERTLTGQRTFERQNTILKLALAHVQILATRRCLLLDLGMSISLFAHSRTEQKLSRALKECVAAIITILDTVETLKSQNQCYGPFWSTQYIALVGISTFYVLLIQSLRLENNSLCNIEEFLNVDTTFSMAEQCHNHLATLPPQGSQAARHHSLLIRLRSRAQKSLERWRNGLQPPVRSSRKTDDASGPIETTNPLVIQPTSVQRSNESNKEDYQYEKGEVSQHHVSTDNQRNTAESRMTAVFAPGFGEDYDANDFSMFSTMLTPNSNSDSTFQYKLDFGWESLDMVGPSATCFENLYRI